ncbi:hypothetical protein [Flavobacterium sp.]|uniref:hypothetical protein n=1 Tax=Flavobacterium sp. TaxID=239 RepID=UPI00260E7A8C|nr:hypothetical protein [Flavobacterium sp.]
MRKIVMLFVVLLGTSFMVNANTITPKANTSKEVRTLGHKKHRKVKKADAKKIEAGKPTEKNQK